MATFYVLNNKKYRTSVRLRDGRLEAIRFEPEVYFGGIGQRPIPPPIRRLSKLSKTLCLRNYFLGKGTDRRGRHFGTERHTRRFGSATARPDNAIREETVTSVASARAWLQANLDYVIPAGMKKDDIKIEAAKRNVLFIQW